MIKHGNKYIRPEKVDYRNLINVWVDETKRIEMVKILMLSDKTFYLEKLRTNPLYFEAYKEIIVERERELSKYDNSWLWSRKYTPEKFFRFIAPFICYLLFIAYIFYKVLPRRLLYLHVKYGEEFEELRDFFKIDFENKDIYPDSIIKVYFEIKKENEWREQDKKKALEYSDKFVQNISTGYLTGLSKRRQQFGFDDDKI
jgi:hypothetical protein